MGIHMKTTLEIDEGVMRQLKERAAHEGRTMSELVETALRALLDEKPAPYDVPPMPTFDSGGFLMNIDSRAEYLDAMDDDLEGDDVPRREPGTLLCPPALDGLAARGVELGVAPRRVREDVRVDDEHVSPSPEDRRDPSSTTTSSPG